MAKKKNEPPSDPASELPARSAPLVDGKPLVFISHDSRDADIAEAFSNLLTDATGGALESFRSSDKRGPSGIEYGAEWYNAIMDKIGAARDVVALLTPFSLDRPWILYEAGVAAGTLRVTVMGVAIGLPLEKASSTGPFARFQNCGDDDDSLTKLVMQLAKRNPNCAPREEAVRRQVKVFLEIVDGLKKKRTEKGAAPAATKVDETTVAKLFEEVKVLFRDLPDQVESRIHHAARRGPLSSKRLRFMHPMMFEEMLFRGDAEHPERDGDMRAAAWLVFVSMFRDEMPWVYELGMDVYRAMRDEDRERTEEASQRMRHTLRSLSHSPLLDEMDGPEGREGHMTRRNLEPVIDHFLHHIVSSKRHHRGRRDTPPSAKPEPQAQPSLAPDDDAKPKGS